MTATMTSKSFNTASDVDMRLADRMWRLTHLYTITDTNGALVRFTPNRAQLHFDKNKALRNIILKSRKLGFTTFEAVDMLDETLFTKSHDSVMLSFDAESQIDIFDKKVDLAWQHFPLKDLYSVENDRANMFKFGFGNGIYSSFTVKLSSRGGNPHRLHISEFAKLCAKFPDKALEVIDGTIASVPLSGRVDIESTAEGDYGDFYDMFKEAMERGDPRLPTQYKAHFYNWTWDDAVIDSVVADTASLPSEFREYQQRYQLTDKQITYYYIKFLSLKRDWKLLQQNYPTTWQEAFISSGGKFFDMQVIESHTAYILPTQADGNWLWIKDYTPGHAYAIGGDPSEGVGRNASAAVVWDFTPLKPEVVATFADPLCDPIAFAYELRRAAVRYGSCLIAPESNSIGYATIAKLKEIYDTSLIYSDTNFGYDEDRSSGKLGWSTNNSTKPKMLNDFKNAVHNFEVKIPSAALLEQMRTYPNDDVTQTFKRTDQHHWDLLMAAAIGYQMANVAMRRTRIPVTTNATQTTSHLTSAI